VLDDHRERNEEVGLEVIGEQSDFPLYLRAGRAGIAPHFRLPTGVLVLEITETSTNGYARLHEPEKGQGDTINNVLEYDAPCQDGGDVTQVKPESGY
jgi:hypothetical protein